MRVALKQWLRSHWGEMSANDRARFAEQTLYLAPGGAGITSMRERYERWLQILADEPLLLKTPLVRFQHKLTLGANEAEWKSWTGK